MAIGLHFDDDAEYDALEEYEFNMFASKYRPEYSDKYSNNSVKND